MSTRTQAVLRQLAARYIWWKSPREAMRFPDRVVAQVMDIGTLEDVQLLSGVLEDGALGRVLRNAEAGWFRPRSWTYWHHRLGLVALREAVPPLPGRKVPS